MKKLLFSAILITGLCNAQISSFPWTESFEDASPTLSQWTQVQESGTRSWTTESSYYAYTPGTPFAGSKMALFNCASFSMEVTKYISPVLNLTGSTGGTLEFKYRNKIWGSDQNILKVYYRTSSTGAWTLLQTYQTNVIDWTSSGVITLPSPTSTYQIALEGVAMYGYNITVDELVVTSASLSTHDAVKNETFSIFPNPVSDVLNIKSNQEIVETMIFDSAGKIVIKTIKNNNQINIGDLSSGIYFVQTKDKTGNINRQKFIKK